MKRLTPEELHARLIVFIGCTLAVVFALSVMAFIDLLTTLTVFLTGSLGGVLASNGLKSRQPTPEKPNDTPSAG